MNWLAHVFLSEPTVEFRLGNLLADLVRGDERVGLPSEFLRGAACHKAIDAYTDRHPIVRQSRHRLAARHRRFSGVLIDIFYDYFLAQQWACFAAEPLDEFTAAFYASARHRSLPLPQDAQATLDRIISHDLLGRYRAIEGVEQSLRRLSTYLSRRWGRPFALETSVADLIELEPLLAEDFAAFFPQLHAHVRALQV